MTHAFLNGYDQYGGMGYAQFATKYEFTGVPVEQTIDDYQRDILKKVTTDPALFEEDGPRGGTIGNQITNFREMGMRAGAYPDNPDLFTGFTDPDQRGWTGEVDWDRYKTESRRRVDKIDTPEIRGWHGPRKSIFASDVINNTTGGGVNPFTLYPAIRDAQQEMQMRLKIFQDSKVGFHAGGRIALHTSRKMNESNFAPEGIGYDTQFISEAQRNGKTVMMSNDFHIGDRVTTDNIFQVSEYGRTFKRRQDMTYANQTKLIDVGPLVDITTVATTTRLLNRIAGDIGRRKGLATCTQRPNESVIASPLKSLKPSEAASILSYLEVSGKWGNSNQMEVRRANVVLDKKLIRIVDWLEKTSPNERLSLDAQLKQIATRGALLGDVRRAKDGTQVSQKVLEVLESAARARRQAHLNPSQDPLSISLDVKQSPSPFIRIMEDKATPTSIPLHEKRRQDTEVTQKEGEQRAVANYRWLMMSAPQTRIDAMTDQQVTESDTLTTAKDGKLPVNIDTGTAQIDNEFGRDDTADRGRIRMGTKYTRNNIEMEQPISEV